MRFRPGYWWRRLVLVPALLLSAFVWGEAQPAFWQVQGKGVSVYLLGSMHFGQPDFYPLPEAVEQAFERALVLVVEVDIAHLDPALATRALIKHAQLPAGKTLATVLPQSVYLQLGKLCERMNLPLAAFDQFQPWFVAMQLVEQEIRSSALQQNLGIDLHFLKRAGSRRIDELESIDSQLSLFSSSPLEEQAVFLQQTMDDLQHSNSYLAGMASAWRSGDTRALEAFLVESFRKTPDTRALYNRVILQRNLLMAEAVKAYLKQNQTVFFVVGAGHMVGEDGIIKLLEREQFEVRRLR